MQTIKQANETLKAMGNFKVKPTGEGYVALWFGKTMVQDCITTDQAVEIAYDVLRHQ